MKKILAFSFIVLAGAVGYAQDLITYTPVSPGNNATYTTQAVDNLQLRRGVANGTTQFFIATYDVFAGTAPKTVEIYSDVLESTYSVVNVSGVPMSGIPLPDFKITNISFKVNGGTATFDLSGHGYIPLFDGEGYEFPEFKKPLVAGGGVWGLYNYEVSVGGTMTIVFNGYVPK